MIDPSRFEDLHIVRKVKETIRKWWRIELSFADADGQVVDHGKGRVVPGHSPFCMAALGQPAGFGLCLHSIQDAVKHLANGTDHKAVLIDLAMDFTSCSVQCVPMAGSTVPSSRLLAVT